MPPSSDSDEADEDLWDLSGVPTMDAHKCMKKLKMVKQILQNDKGEDESEGEEAARDSHGSTHVEIKMLATSCAVGRGKQRSRIVEQGV